MAFLGLLVQNRDPIWGVTTLNSPCWYSCLLACPFRPVQVGMFVAPSLIFSSIPPTSVCICVSTRSHNHFLIAKWGFPGSSARKECTCSAGDPGSIPESGKIPWRSDWLPTPVFMGFPGGSDSKEFACDVGNLGSIPGLGRSPRGGYGNLFQYSCLEKPMVRGAWWATVHRITKSQTWLSAKAQHTIIKWVLPFVYFLTSPFSTCPEMFTTYAII